MISFLIKGRIVSSDEFEVETINKIEAVFKTELGISFKELLEDTKVIEMDFESKMDALLHGICGMHFEDKKEVWLSDLDDIQTIAHEFTHVAQCRRKGLKHNVLRALTKFSSRMLTTHDTSLFYNIDLYEKEARYIASKIK